MKLTFSTTTAVTITATFTITITVTVAITTITVTVTVTTIATASITQIVAINAIGVAIGTLGSLLLSLSFPVEVPIVFTGDSVVSAVTALLLIGPMGGLVSVFALLKIEPLTALGLAQ